MLLLLFSRAPLEAARKDHHESSSKPRSKAPARNWRIKKPAARKRRGA